MFFFVTSIFYSLLLYPSTVVSLILLCLEKYLVFNLFQLDKYFYYTFLVRTFQRRNVLHPYYWLAIHDHRAWQILLAEHMQTMGPTTTYAVFAQSYNRFGVIQGLQLLKIGFILWRY